MEKTALEILIGMIEANPELATPEWVLQQCREIKECERMQIINAYYAGTAQFDNAAAIIWPKTPQVYYNETYGGI